MNAIAGMDEGLREHLDICAALRRVDEQENATLQAGADTAHFDAARKELFSRLERSVTALKDVRCRWQGLAPEARAANRDLRELIQLTQNAILGALALQRENERIRLRRGLLPPTRVPSANLERPHFVSELYRRHG